MSNFFRLLWVLALAALGYFMLTPDPSLADRIRPDALDEVSRFGRLDLAFPPDKVSHFAAFFCIGALTPLTRLPGMRNFLMALLALYGFGFLLEHGQGVWNGRHNELGDMIANGLGAVLGLSVGFVLEALRAAGEDAAVRLRSFRSAQSA